VLNAESWRNDPGTSLLAVWCVDTIWLAMPVFKGWWNTFQGLAPSKARSADKWSSINRSVQSRPVRSVLCIRVWKVSTVYRNGTAKIKLSVCTPWWRRMGEWRNSTSDSYPWRCWTFTVWSKPLLVWQQGCKFPLVSAVNSRIAFVD
jgi:hypothetical protein